MTAGLGRKFQFVVPSSLPYEDKGEAHPNK